MQSSTIEKAPKTTSKKRSKNDPIVTECATVSDQDPNGFIVQTESGHFPAKPALSCLIVPEVGDKVQLLRDSEGVCYILSILERSPETDVVIAFKGNVQMNSLKGSLCFVANQNIDLISAKDVNLVSENLDATAKVSRFQLGNLTVFSTTVSAYTEQVKVFAESIDTVLDRWSLRAKNCFRWIEGMDHLKASELFRLVRNTLTMHSRHAIISAEKDIKIDGERVHMG